MCRCISSDEHLPFDVLLTKWKTGILTADLASHSVVSKQPSEAGVRDYFFFSNLTKRLVSSLEVEIERTELQFHQSSDTPAESGVVALTVESIEAKVRLDIDGFVGRIYRYTNAVPRGTPSGVKRRAVYSQVASTARPRFAGE